MTKKEIAELLASLGFAGVYSRSDLSRIFRVSVTVINHEHHNGHLQSVAKGVYAISDIVNWLYLRPRYLTVFQTLPNLPWLKDCNRLVKPGTPPKDSSRREGLIHAGE